MRIAIDIRKIGKKSTGSEVVFYYLVTKLAKLKESKKHQFLLLTDDKISKVKAILKSLPKNFKIYRVTPANKILWTFYSLPRFLKEKAVDIFETEYTVPFYLKKSIKIVTIIHDISFKVNPGWITKKDSMILNTLIPPSIKRADAIMTVSDFTKNEIIEKYQCPAEKIFVAHPAVDQRTFFSVSEVEAKKEIKKILGDNSPYILHISSMQPRKNVPLVISAFGKLKRKLKKENSSWKNIKLVLVGDKKGHNFDQKIEAEILKQTRLENIGMEDLMITGYQSASKLPYFYKMAKMFIFPSAYEGFGLPIIEAMASGTPVIASDIEVFKEVAGDAATYIKIGRKNSSENLVAAMKKIIENNKFRESKIKLGQERAEEFDWKEIAEKTMKVYKSF